MNKFSLRAAVLGFALILPITAQAQIDQQWSPLFPVQPANITFGQSFTPTKSNITGAGTLLTNMSDNSVTANLRIAVFGKDADGNPTLADMVQAYTLLAHETKWVDISFSAQPISPGYINYLQFLSDDASGDVWSNDDITGSYAGGEAFDTAPEGTWEGDATFYSTDDFAFRTFYEATSAPEPASILLMATGLVGIVGVARRRKVAR